MRSISRLELSIMIGLLFVTQAATDIFLSGLPKIATEFSASINETNSIISVFGYSQAVFVLIIGVISDLCGRRPIILLCLCLHIMASLVIALSHHLSLIILMRIFQALGGAATYIVFRLAIKDVMDKKAQIHATGLFVVGLVLSPTIAPVFGSWLIVYSGWRACFWAIALMELPLILGVFAFFQETNTQQKEYRARFSFKQYLLNYLSIVKNPYFLRSALLVGGTFGAFFSFISISSFIFVDEFSVSHIDYAYIFIGIAGSYLLGNRIMSYLNAHDYSSKKIIGVGIFLGFFGVLCIFCGLFLKSSFIVLLLLSLGACFLRLATALVNPPVQVLVINHFEDIGSFAIGLLTAFQYGASACATVLVSSLSFKPSLNFVITTTIFMSASVIAYGFYSKKQKLV